MKPAHYACACTVGMLLALAPSVKAETAYAVDYRALLLTFDTRLPSFVTAFACCVDCSPERYREIDFRPANKSSMDLAVQAAYI
jgi:hypothetical protein